MDPGGAAVAGWEWEWWQLLFTMVVLLVVRITRQWNRLECYPGPPGLPLVGHFHLLFGAAGRLDDIFDFFTEICQANNGVCLFRAPFAELIPASNVILTTDPRDVEHILKTSFSNYIKGPVFIANLSDLLGDGIFNSNGEAWRVQRKAASHEFSVSKFRDFMSEVFVHHAFAVVDHLGELCDGPEANAGVATTVDMQTIFSKFTLLSIGEIAFGVDLGCLKTDVPFETAFDAVTVCVIDRFLYPWWRLNRAMGWAREPQLAEALATVHAFADGVIADRRELSQTDLDARSDLLSRFMRLKDEHGKLYSDEYLRSVVINFILAGRDTTAVCLSWFFYALARNPRVELAVRNEIEDQGDGFDPASFDALRKNKMPYLHAVVTETLRLYPSVPSDEKTAVEDDVLPSGHKIKAGWGVNYQPYAAGRMKNLWGDDAEEFRPERFLTATDSGWVFAKPSPYKFSAFQAGKRICLGMDMAYLEAKTAVVLLMQKYRFSLSKGHEVCRYGRSITLTIENFRMDIKPNLERPPTT